jgi:dTDP-4-amino-4,6-dideoxygalactose transaminase
MLKYDLTDISRFISIFILIQEKKVYITEIIVSHKICGDDRFTKNVILLLEQRFNSNKILFTAGGSVALDMAFLLCDIKTGDGVILPSYTLCYSQNRG